MPAGGPSRQAARRAQCGGKLARELEGPAYEVFARALRGLAATKLTKPGTFRCMDGGGEGHALRCSYKACCMKIPCVAWHACLFLTRARV